MFDTEYGSLAELADKQARTALAEADVIVGLDASSQREFTVFGTPSLESSVTFKRPSAMRVVRVTVDCAAGELEQLAAMVRAVKRAHAVGG